MIKHISIKVTGRVQGVWFRQSTFDKASELGLTGSVENRQDGSVQIEAEGEDDKLRELVDWCRQGPEHASVEEIEYSYGEVQDFSSFRIK